MVFTLFFKINMQLRMLKIVEDWGEGTSVMSENKCLVIYLLIYTVDSRYLEYQGTL